MSRYNSSNKNDDEIIQCIWDDDVTRFQTLLRKYPDLLNTSRATFDLYPSYIMSGIANSKISPNGQTILHLIAFYDAIDILLYILKAKRVDSKKADLFYTKNVEDYLPIHLACYGASFNVVSLILNYCPELAKYEIPSHYQLLALATYAQSPEIIDILFSYGLDPESKFNRYSDEKHPLPIKIAIQYQDIGCIRSLLKGGNRSRQSHSSLLIEALRQYCFDAIPLLLAAHEDPEEVVFQQMMNQTAVYTCPLSAACFHGPDATDAIRHIVSKISGSLLPVSSNPLDGGPAHWIAKSKSVEVARIFASRGFDPNYRDYRGNSAINALIARKNTLENMKGILDIYLEQGLNLNEEYDSQKNFEPHIMAVLRIDKTTENYKFQLIEWFAKNGQSLDIKCNKKKQTLKQYILENMKKRSDEIFGYFEKAKKQNEDPTAI